MTPKQRYQQDILSAGFQKDEAQYAAVSALDELYHLILADLAQAEAKLKFWQRFRPNKVQPNSIKGLYFWGGVGRGKTYLMDLFFDALPIENKMRVHFHRFMQWVHEELKQTVEQSDPLKTIAKKLSQQTKVLCFDEFFVSDITDAMLLAGLFEALFQQGIILVATSNIAPQNLYLNGLQRARFLPTIALIEQHCRVLNVDGGVDYRLRTLTQAAIFYYPLGEQATQQLNHYYAQLTHTSLATLHKTQLIEINHRQVPVINSSNGVLYASFEQLCQSARSQYDYIELAKRYHTVLLADVKAMSQSLDDAARRFIALVDEFYERQVKLIISSEVAMEHLYNQGQLSFEFQRCLSRLIEMQSEEYLALEHQA